MYAVRNSHLKVIENNVIKDIEFKEDKGSKKKQSHTRLNATKHLTLEEISLVIGEYKRRIDCAKNHQQEAIARRNLCMFVCSISIGLRASDFLDMKYEGVFDNNWEFIEDGSTYTRKSQKDVELYFNENFKKAILDYVAWKRKNGYELKLEDYIFVSKKGGALCRQEWWKINSNTCKAAGIKKKIGTHGNRKTLARMMLDANSEAYEETIYDIGKLFGHTSKEVTEMYLNLDKERRKKKICNIPSIY